MIVFKYVLNICCILKHELILWNFPEVWASELCVSVLTTSVGYPASHPKTVGVINNLIMNNNEK